ncbi:hypothetical protein [Leptospira weilii]|uniref:hypothetical protein n=3 Tax=Leptospira weilii TaxID=28184 RepID=UPI0003200374|nr:hypothetical protein [Leptospira weilii]
MDRHNSAAASLWIGITQRLPLYGSAARSQHRIAFAFCYTKLALKQMAIKRKQYNGQAAALATKQVHHKIAKLFTSF